MGVEKINVREAKALRERLTEISDSAPRGCHSYVCDRLDISISNLKLIRNGERRVLNSDRNLKYIIGIIELYQEYIDGEIKRLSKI